MARGKGPVIAGDRELPGLIFADSIVVMAKVALEHGSQAASARTDEDAPEAAPA